VQVGKSPREAMVQLLSIDKEEGRRRYRFRPVDQLKAGRHTPKQGSTL
jgi:hypothetical protein